MNNVFDFKRFGNYFLYDLRNAKNNYGLSLLILGCLPIAIFLVVQLFSLIFTQQVTTIGMVPKYVQIGVVAFVTTLGAGAKIYGHLTEKKAGSNFLMLPASTLEKWLSMSLVVCIAVPLVLFGLQIASDALMSLIFPTAYGARVYELIPLQQAKDSMAEVGISFNFAGYMFVEWCESILLFTLGAIVFKKSKIAKTILCLLGFSFLLSTIMMIIIGFDGVNVYFNWLEHYDTVTGAVQAANWTMNISFIVTLGLILGGMYYRIRTLKH
jgi:hypothetical protein